MSVARAETELATILLIELMTAVAEEEEFPDDELRAAALSTAPPQPDSTAA